MTKTTTTPAGDIAAIIEKTRPRPPQTCHTVDARGWALCGAFGPQFDEDGERDTSRLHSKKLCRARGHRHCVLCTELDRQLGDDAMVA